MLDIAAPCHAPPATRRQVFHQRIRLVHAQHLNKPLVQRPSLPLADYHPAPSAARQRLSDRDSSTAAARERAEVRLWTAAFAGGLWFVPRLQSAHQSR